VLMLRIERQAYASHLRVLCENKAPRGVDQSHQMLMLRVLREAIMMVRESNDPVNHLAVPLHHCPPAAGNQGSLGGCVRTQATAIWMWA